MNGLQGTPQHAMHFTGDPWSFRGATLFKVVKQTDTMTETVIMADSKKLQREPCKSTLQILCFRQNKQQLRSLNIYLTSNGPDHGDKDQGRTHGTGSKALRQPGQSFLLAINGKQQYVENTENGPIFYLRVSWEAPPDFQEDEVVRVPKTFL